MTKRKKKKPWEIGARKKITLFMNFFIENVEMHKYLPSEIWEYLRTNFCIFSHSFFPYKFVYCCGQDPDSPNVLDFSVTCISQVIK